MSTDPETGQDATGQEQSSAHEDEERVRITPGLVVAGVVALLIGAFAGLVMSAAVFAR